jgi:endonuclease/exonuclease/phosphatase family metal-dependent hydrolase
MSGVHLVSYNIQFGLGKDGRFDTARQAGEIGAGGDAAPDLVALQEVVRNFPPLGIVDQAADFVARFPGYDWVYGPALDLSTALIAPGAAPGTRTQFGNMLLSRWPIVSSRNHMLPKLDLGATLSLQRAALECVVAAPDGPLRVYVIHLAHASAEERGEQVEMLLAQVAGAPETGGVWSGDAKKAGFTLPSGPPPMPGRAILAGDFNMTVAEPAHGRIVAAGLPDTWARAGKDPAAGETCEGERIDFIFATETLAAAVEAAWIDDAAVGSDHQPLHVRFA